MAIWSQDQEGELQKVLKMIVDRVVGSDKYLNGGSQQVRIE